MSKNIDPTRVLVLHCTVCPFVTQKLERLFSHIGLFHPRPILVDIFYCEACGAVASSCELLEEHIEIHHPTDDAKTASTKAQVLKLFSQTVNENRKGGEEANGGAAGGRRPLLGKSFDAAPGGDVKKDKWVCDVCRVILDSEELMRAHTAEKHPFPAQSSAVVPSATGKQNGSYLTPLVCLDIRHLLTGQPVYLKDQGCYIIDMNRDGVTARIKYYPKFFSKLDSDRFLRVLGDRETGWQQRSIMSRQTGKEVKEPRMTRFIGPVYEYSGVRWEENLTWPDELTEIKDAVEAASGNTFNSVLGTMYRSGQDSIGWHSDDEPELGKYPTIGSVSFGATRAFEFSKPGYTPPYVCVYLSHGDLMVTEGCIQERWKHRVAKEPAVRERRVNFTFRTVTPSLRKSRGAKGGRATATTDKEATVKPSTGAGDGVKAEGVVAPDCAEGASAPEEGAPTSVTT